MPERVFRWSMVVVFIVALVLRLGWVGLMLRQGMPVLRGDAALYDRLALNLITHGHYSLADGPPYTPTGFVPPVWPTLLGVFYAAVGYRPAAALLMTSVIGALTIALTILLARQLVGERAALAAGLLLSVDPTHVVLSGSLYTECLATCLLTIAVLCILILWKPNAPWYAAPLGGLALGLGILTRPAFIVALFPLTVLATLDIRRGRWVLVRRTTMIIGMCVLMCGVWMARNLVVFGAFSIASSGGAFLWTDNRGLLESRLSGEPSGEVIRRFQREFPAGLPPPSSPADATKRARGLVRIGTIDEFRDDAILTRAAIKEITGYPTSVIAGQLAVSLSTSLFGFSRGDIAQTFGGSKVALVVAAGIWVITLLLSATGPLVSPALRRHRRATGFMIALVIVVCLAPLFIGYSRYRVPIDPLLCVFAGGALVTTATRLARRLRSP